ncbi:arginyl-tRNA--protein transferase 1 isoform X2 [Zophobas morio]|uniref:arginyl-tRNA--protein transferase 1 isoform X2 n=1 Tax=Zophobas morio TaxID=2755281 RepID=UPI00308394B3
MSDCSIVYWCSSLEKHMCGYCKNARGNVSHGMWAKSLTVEDYQNLIDRGWRRSGSYCYKPLMNATCCPMYTIKCDTQNFQLSKSQKKVIKNFNKFSKDGELKKSGSQQNFEETADNVSDFVYREAPRQIVAHEQLMDSDIVLENSEVVSLSGGSKASKVPHEPIPSTSQITEQNSVQYERLKQPKSGVGADPTKPPCKKAKLVRMERKKEKLLKRGMSLEKIEVRNEQKSLEEFLNEVSQDGKHKFKMTLEQIHEKHKYFRLTADLFAKYQMSIHNDSAEECDDLQYLNFLIDTPLQHVKFSKDSELGFGSFHQLYWLDDKLIAVGVIDILPKCVSAVYFFYDPDYRDLTLGTYGSLREVEFARSLHLKRPSIQNYYMGFYIHSCTKMRYKGKLTPSFLLCPETYHWIPIEKCLQKLEVSKYSRLDEDQAATDENVCSGSDLDEIKVIKNRKLILFRQFKLKYGGQELFNIIGQLVGQKCSKSLIFMGDHL